MKKRGLWSLALILLLVLGLASWRALRRAPSSQGPKTATAALTLIGAPLEKAGQFIAALEIGHEEATLSFIKATTVPWQEPRLIEHEPVFTARLEKAGEAPRSFEFGVRGLIPLGLHESMKDHHEVGLGDELSSRSVAVLLKLPVMAPPFELCIQNTQGKEVLRIPILGREGRAP